MIRREKGSSRPPLTDEQRRMKPPVHHPVFLEPLISGRKVIYVNPGFTERIDGWPPDESSEMLEFLFEHVLKPEYRYVYRWSVRDVLLWEHIGTWHNAVGDYRPDEYRLMKRCQVMADRVFDRQFVQNALAA
jgi:taurine dioxygenase